MSFDLKGLEDAVQAQGEVVRVVIADLAGSSPREVGAAMLVWRDGQSGTIGGGALEFQAAEAARRMLADGRARTLGQHALGPDLGQCCGGRVTLLSERYDIETLSSLSTEIIARACTVDNPEAPLSVQRVLSRARGQGQPPVPQLIDGWLIEPVLRPTRAIWIWGAGHVGRAIVDVLAPFPDLKLTWIDTGPDRFPDKIAPDVTVIAQKKPTDLTPYAPAEAEHYILTYSHALDLELCHRILTRGFGFAGLIGSTTKWARFRKRLAELGHLPAQVDRIACPIGDPGLGKHPAQIAIGVAGDVIRRGTGQADKKDKRA